MPHSLPRAESRFASLHIYEGLKELFGRKRGKIISGFRIILGLTSHITKKNREK